MSRVRRFAFAVGLAALLGTTSSACGSAPEFPDLQNPAEEHADPALDVTTVAARRGPIAQRISASGALEARRESRIGTEVQGRILRIHVDDGDRVEEGALLFEIDPEPYEMALRQAEARLDLARAQRRQSEADVKRAQSLRARNVLAAQEIERLETGLLVARADERQALEAVAMARHQLERTQIRSPWAGSVAARLADEGSTALVQPQTIVLVLQETGQLEARASIPESQLARIRIGDPAEIHVEGLSDPIQTRVSAVGDVIDPATRTYTVRMPVANPEHRLKAGVFALVEIAPQAKSDALLVPRDAIRSEDGRTRVFTIVEGRSTARDVTIGLVARDTAEVLSGLDVGEPVITGEAAGQIAPGMRVRVTARNDES